MVGSIINISATPGWFSKTDDITIRMIDDALHARHMHNGVILAKCHGPGVGGCAVCWRVALRCVMLCYDVF